MNYKKFLAFSVLISIIIIIILSIFSINEGDEYFYSSILFGNLQSFLNFILGIGFISYGIEKTDKIFLQTLFAGVLTRLIILLVLVILTLKFLEINDINYIFSLLFFYIFYIVIEVIYLILRKR